MNAYTPMTSADIARMVEQRETRLAAIIAKYDLAPVNVPPFFACTERDLAAALDKMERKCA